MKNYGLTQIYLLFLLVFLLGSSSLFSQVSVSHVDNVSSFSGKQGVFYALPMTGIRFQVRVKKVQQFKGPYSEYAYRFLGLDDVIMDNSESYELVDISMHTFTIPDPQQLFYVEFGTKASKEDRDLMLALSKSGMAIENTSNLSGDMPEFDVVELEDVIEMDNVRFKDPDELFRYYATTNQVEKIDTIIKRIFLDTTVIEDISFKRSMVYKTLEQRASEAADFIVEIRENRFNLLTGYQEVDYDIETFQYMDQELMKLEEEYISLFNGKSIQGELTYSFSYIPSEATGGVSDLLFRFSNDSGVLEAASAGGDPVNIDNIPLGLFSEQTNYDVFNRNSSNEGFAYRIPATVDMTVSYKGAELINSLVNINQLGAVGVVKVTDGTGIQFDPITGQVVRILLK